MRNCVFTGLGLTEIELNLINLQPRSLKLAQKKLPHAPEFVRVFSVPYSFGFFLRPDGACLIRFDSRCP